MNIHSRRFRFSALLAAGLVLPMMSSPAGVGRANADDVLPTSAGAAGTFPPRFLTGSEFRRELARPITVARDDAELREMLQRIATDRAVAIVLDRRIDPSTPRDVHLGPITVETAVETIARQAGAAVTILGDTLLVGPPNRIGQARTLVALREAELQRHVDALQRRSFELIRKQTFHWVDLDRPSDLVQQIARQYRLDIAGLELVPHDLWAGASVVNVSAAEALTLVLIQFDLSFEWTGNAEGIRIVPLPEHVAIVREHAIKPANVAEVRERIRRSVPGIEMQWKGTRTLIVTGTVEQQEQVAVLARGGQLAEPARPAGFGPLSRRQFTLTVVRQPASAVIRTLQANGIAVNYDADQLRAAGIDLDQKISLSLTKAPPDALFRALCEPLGLTFVIDDDAVTLTVQR